MSVAAGILALMGAGFGKQKYDQYQADQVLQAEEAKQAALLDERNAQMTGLMGAPNQPYLLDASQQFNPGEQIPGLQTAGTGLLADPANPVNQLQYAGGLMQIPGMEAQGTGVLNAALQRQQQSAQFDQTFAANQQKAQQAMALEAQRRGQNFGFDDKAQLATTVNTLQTTHDKQVAPLRESLYKYEDVMRRFDLAGQDLNKMTGTDDLQMMRAFIKMANGGREAFMQDDEAATKMATLGFGSAESLLKMIQGKGTMDQKGRAMMLSSMNSLAQGMYGRLQGERRLLEEKARQFGIPTDLVMRGNVNQPMQREFKVMTPKQRAAKVIEDRKAKRVLPPGFKIIPSARADQGIRGRVNRDG